MNGRKIKREVYQIEKESKRDIKGCYLEVGQKKGWSFLHP
jgi:hypothetical protein